jgi:hypothetical protein
MTAGQVWRRRGGVRWVEVQAGTMEPSGWRLMVPLVGLADAPEAPPLVITVGQQRARVHLLTTALTDELGTAEGELTPEDLASLRDAIRTLIQEP